MSNLNQYPDLVVLGSTGSVGEQAVDVARKHRIPLRAVTAHKSVETVEAQVREFSPDFAVMTDEAAAADLRARVADTDTRVLAGFAGITEMFHTVKTENPLGLTVENSILGEAPSDEVVKTIKSVVDEYPRALGMHDLIVHSYGPGHTFAALHIEIDGNEDIFEIHDMVDLIEQRLRHEHHIDATVHMDPIVTDNEEINKLREKVVAAIARIDERFLIHDFRFVPGETHTNLIFDVAVPFEIKQSEEEIRRLIATEVSRIDPSYFTVITIDKV